MRGSRVGKRMAACATSFAAVADVMATAREQLTASAR